MPTIKERVLHRLRDGGWRRSTALHGDTRVLNDMMDAGALERRQLGRRYEWRIVRQNEEG